MDATNSMIRAAAREATSLRELQEAAYDHGTTVEWAATGTFHVSGPWLAVHRTCQQAEGHLSVPVVMGDEVSPNTYVVNI
jgi:hypothetical protein